jgi:flagellar hook-length control protein FliK
VTQPRINTHPANYVNLLRTYTSAASEKSAPISQISFVDFLKKFAQFDAAKAENAPGTPRSVGNPNNGGARNPQGVNRRVTQQEHATYPANKYATLPLPHGTSSHGQPSAENSGSAPATANSSEIVKQHSHQKPFIGQSRLFVPNTDVQGLTLSKGLPKRSFDHPDEPITQVRIIDYVGGIQVTHSDVQPTFERPEIPAVELSEPRGIVLPSQATLQFGYSDRLPHVSLSPNATVAIAHVSQPADPPAQPLLKQQALNLHSSQQTLESAAQLFIPKSPHGAYVQSLFIVDDAVTAADSSQHLGTVVPVNPTIKNSATIKNIAAADVNASVKGAQRIDLTKHIQPVPEHQAHIIPFPTDEQISTHKDNQPSAKLSVAASDIVKGKTKQADKHKYDAKVATTEKTNHHHSYSASSDAATLTDSNESVHLKAATISTAQGTVQHALIAGKITASLIESLVTQFAIPTLADATVESSIHTAQENQFAQQQIAAPFYGGSIVAPQTADQLVYGSAHQHTAPASHAAGSPSFEQTQAHEQLLYRISQAFENQQGDNGTVRFKLHVPNLGPINIDINVNNTSFSAAISAESSATRQLVSDYLPDLRHRLAQQGVDQDHLDIRVVNPQNESSADDSGNPPQQHYPKAPPLPRIANGPQQHLPFQVQLNQVALDLINVQV